jgi:hypothetical protein
MGRFGLSGRPSKSRDPNEMPVFLWVRFHAVHEAWRQRAVRGQRAFSML